MHNPKPSKVQITYSFGHRNKIYTLFILNNSLELKCNCTLVVRKQQKTKKCCMHAQLVMSWKSMNRSQCKIWRGLCMAWGKYMEVEAEHGTTKKTKPKIRGDAWCLTLFQTFAAKWVHLSDSISQKYASTQMKSRTGDRSLLDARCTRWHMTKSENKEETQEMQDLAWTMFLGLNGVCLHGGGDRANSPLESQWIDTHIPAQRMREHGYFAIKKTGGASFVKILSTKRKINKRGADGSDLHRIGTSHW